MSCSWIQVLTIRGCVCFCWWSPSVNAIKPINFPHTPCTFKHSCPTLTHHWHSPTPSRTHALTHSHTHTLSLFHIFRLLCRWQTQRQWISIHQSFLWPELWIATMGGERKSANWYFCHQGYCGEWTFIVRLPIWYQRGYPLVLWYCTPLPSDITPLFI